MLKNVTSCVSLALFTFLFACSSAPSSQPFSEAAQGVKFYVDPQSQAANDAQSMRSNGSPDAHYIEYIARQGAAVWYGEWSGDIAQAVRRQVAGALEQDALAVMVAYNIPHRDCGQHSAGGLPSDKYRTWVSDMAAAIGESKVLVILEPDAVPLNECLSEGLKAERYELLNFAIKTFKEQPNTKVYIDAGHPRWLAADEAATRLKKAGIRDADGFALNTSNYQTTGSNAQYGKAISSKLGGKHFVIDTSRNGTDPKDSADWCNPQGRSLGIAPTSLTQDPLIDAFLWAKIPGESDGNCNGGPAAGQWWREKAIELAKNAEIKAGQTSVANETPTQPSQKPIAPVAPLPQHEPVKAPSQPAPVASNSGSGSSSSSSSSSSSATIEVTITVQSQWESGGCYSFSFRNKGTSPVQGWSMLLDLHGGTVRNEWNLVSQAEGARVRVQPGADYLKRIPVGQSVGDAGFCLAGSSLKPSLISIR